VPRPRSDGPASPALTQHDPAPEDRGARVPAPAAGTVPVPSAARTEPVAFAAAPVAHGASHVAAADPSPAVAAIERPSPETTRASLKPPTSREPLDAGRAAPDVLAPPVGARPADLAGDTVTASLEAMPHRPGPAGPATDGHGACTAAQLRRFIKSRAYVPLHELRRRFELDGDEDDVSPIDLGGRRLFVGLPGREARLLGELFEAGDVGYELLLDPTSPLVVGVFPMRPVPRA
jgi:hypothetical protein